MDAAQRSLVSLTLTSMNASGSIPTCLYSAGSQILLLSLSEFQLLQPLCLALDAHKGCKTLKKLLLLILSECNR